MATLYLIELDNKDSKYYFNDKLYNIDAKKYGSDKWVLGDVIGILNDIDYVYTNQGKVMWSGNKLIKLHSNLDTYPSVPRNIPVGSTGLTTNFWQDIIEHNYYIYAKFNEELHKIINNFWSKTKLTIEMRDLYSKYNVMSGEKREVVNDRYIRGTLDIYEYRTISFEFNGTRWGIIIPSTDGYPPAPYTNSDTGLFSYISEDLSTNYSVRDVKYNYTLFYGKLY